MIKVVAIRFRTAGKSYYFDPEDLDIKRGTNVIVETAQGMEYGTAAAPPYEVEDERVTKPLKKILRIATPVDDRQNEENIEKEKEALRLCREKVKEHELEMKLIDSEYAFDRSKLTFYFTADGRVDFRELVKDLASTFRIRIELRQIGVRDATRMLGGIGCCGRELCCHTYMRDFVPVSIKMAKEQNLSLNPGKISGMCGRLMCCLSYEAETYSYLNKHMPRMGEKVKLPDGREGTAQAVDVLRGKVKVMVYDGDERELLDFDASDLEFKKRGGKPKDDPEEGLTKEELENLSALEDKEPGEERPSEGKNRERKNGNNNNNNNRRRDFKDKDGKQKQRREDGGQNQNGGNGKGDNGNGGNNRQERHRRNNNRRNNNNNNVEKNNEQQDKS